MMMDFTYVSATIIQHCSVFGRLETPVRAYAIETPRPYAQYATSVSVAFMEPRKRRMAFYTMVPDNLRYLLIEVQGQVVYDSRTDVPCDMATWDANWARFKGNPPLRTITDLSQVR
jgi:hypothetical protein